MKSRQLILIVALVLAAGTGFLTFSYLNAVGNSQKVGEIKTVYIASQDIQARGAVTVALLTSVQRPAASVEPDAVTKVDDLKDAIALTTIPAGSTITKSRIGKPDNAPLPVRLKPGQRAVTIPVDQVRGVAGLIEPGDRVDVIAVLHTNVSSDGGLRVTTVLHGVLVLAMGTTMEHMNNPQASADAPTAPTATLAVSPKQAELLTLADSVGTLRLSLRPPNDNSRTPADSLVLDTPPPTAKPIPQAAVQVQAAPAPVAAAPAPAPVVVQKQIPAPVHHTTLDVTIIDGDHVVGSGK